MFACRHVYMYSYDVFGCVCVLCILNVTVSSAYLALARELRFLGAYARYAPSLRKVRMDVSNSATHIISSTIDPRDRLSNPSFQLVLQHLHFYFLLFSKNNRPLRFWYRILLQEAAPGSDCDFGSCVQSIFFSFLIASSPAGS
jgi:hypothetical protein